MEVAPTKLLDTKISYHTKIETSVYRSENKIPVHWNSQVPKRYKRNAINADLYRAERISSNFMVEKEIIVEKFSEAGFPRIFTESVITTV